MDKSCRILLWWFSLLAYYLNTVNTDPGHNSAFYNGWNRDVASGVGSVSSASKTPSPSSNQLHIWSNNRTHNDERATTLHGVPVPHLTASQAIGTRGHLLMQDVYLLDKLASFNRERIPERTVHAKGAGALGQFVVTHDISKFTKAKFLNGIGKKTRVAMRFSTVGGERGTADTLVDPNGFAVKFYTEDGNHDLVGNNIESFPLRDPMLFVDINRTRKRNPQTGLFDINMWWDYVSLRAETTLHTLHLHSDIGRPHSYRSNDGFGVHAFKCVNERGHVVFCKFVWRSLQKQPALTHQQNSELVGTNPDSRTQDLYDAIARGDYPSWNLYLQVMTLEEAKRYPKNPFDITRTWRVEQFPLIPIGRMTLNRNPTNYYAEIEQAAFSPANMVPGIEPSPDRMLAARLFSYPDAQRYRLGVNHAQLPINRPAVEVNSYTRDGLACYGDNGGASPNYFPNSFGGAFADTQGAGQVTFSVDGIVDRYDIPEDEHEDARIFLERDVDAEHRERLVDSLAVRLKDARVDIWERVLRNNFYPISKKFGDEVRNAIERYLDRSSNTDNRNSYSNSNRDNNDNSNTHNNNEAKSKFEISHFLSLSGNDKLNF